MAAARPIMPKSFETLLYRERKKVIDAAPLGRTDRKIATMYYLDGFPQADIAVVVLMERSSVSKRLPRIRAILESTAERVI